MAPANPIQEAPAPAARRRTPPRRGAPAAPAASPAPADPTPTQVAAAPKEPSPRVPNPKVVRGNQTVRGNLSKAVKRAEETKAAALQAERELEEAQQAAKTRHVPVGGGAATSKPPHKAKGIKVPDYADERLKAAKLTRDALKGKCYAYLFGGYTGGFCKGQADGSCEWDHDIDLLNVIHPRVDSWCRWFNRPGGCRSGSDCRFKHKELSTTAPAASPAPANPPQVEAPEGSKAQANLLTPEQVASFTTQLANLQALLAGATTQTGLRRQ